MGPFDDIDQFVKILFFVVLFGGWILRAVFRNLIKKATTVPRGQGGAPAKGLREFLKEIRQEGAGGGAPARQVARVEEPAEEELVWEEVEEEEILDEAPRPADQRGEKTLFDERREQWKRETDRRRAERKRQRLEQARRRKEEFQGKQAPEEPPEEWTSVAERQLDSKLDERHIGSDLDDRELQSSLTNRKIGRLKRSAGPTRAGADRSPELVGALRGLTVKELILAEVILGKPRSKKRHIRDV